MGKQSTIDYSFSGELPEYSVRGFFDWIKTEIIPQSKKIKIIGETSKIRPYNFYTVFNLLDQDKSFVKCTIAKKYLKEDMKEGMKIEVTGIPKISESYSDISFSADNIEIIGEGELKKNLDTLKENFQKRGYFDRKRPLPKFAKNIGLITSEFGQVKSDFQKHLANQGFKIIFRNTKMEGPSAVEDIVTAIEEFNEYSKLNIDILVLTRGGGSWESFEPFNSEDVGNAIFNSNIPIICGIGHETDESGIRRETLADLISDYRASTATDIANILSREWFLAKQKLKTLEGEFWKNSEDWLNFMFREFNLSNKNFLHNYNIWIGTYKLEKEKLEKLEREFWKNSEDWVITCDNRIKQSEKDFRSDLTILINKFDRLEREFWKNTEDWIIGYDNRIEQTEKEFWKNSEDWLNFMFREFNRSNKSFMKNYGTLMDIYDTEKDILDRLEIEFWENSKNWVKYVEEQLTYQEKIFDSYNPKNLLKQGWSIVVDSYGETINDITQLKTETIEIVLNKGRWMVDRSHLKIKED